MARLTTDQSADLRRLHIAARIAHGGWDPRVEDTTPRGVFRNDFTRRARWLIVPAGALIFALFVWLAGFLAGAAQQVSGGSR